MISRGVTTIVLLVATSALADDSVPVSRDPPVEDERAAQAWPRQKECVRRMERANRQLDRKLARRTGKWTVHSGRNEVTLVLEGDQSVAGVFLSWFFDRAFRPHPRAPTAPWDNAPIHPPLTKTNRRIGPEQKAYVEYDSLRMDEGKVLESVIEPVLDACLATLDPTVRITSWETFTFDGRFEAGGF
jgi:hypothetical protein